MIEDEKEKYDLKFLDDNGLKLMLYVNITFHVSFSPLGSRLKGP